MKRRRLGWGCLPLTQGAARHDWMTLTGGSIGQGLPLGSAQRSPAPTESIVCLQADGSGMYTVQALWTMARENLDVATVILNNGSYAILNIELMRVGAGDAGAKARQLLDLTNPAIELGRDLEWHGRAGETRRDGRGISGRFSRGAGPQGSLPHRSDRLKAEKPMPTLNLTPASAADYRLLAEKRLPRLFFDYIDGGAYSETTLARNLSDFAAVTLRQRVLRDVSKIDTEDFAVRRGLGDAGRAGPHRHGRHDGAPGRSRTPFGRPKTRRSLLSLDRFDLFA